MATAKIAFISCMPDGHNGEPIPASIGSSAKGYETLDTAGDATSDACPIGCNAVKILASADIAVAIGPSGEASVAGTNKQPVMAGVDVIGCSPGDLVIIGTA